MAIEVKVVEVAGRKFALRWVDPKTGKIRQKTSGTRVRREAERAAERLQRQLDESGGATPTNMGWGDFCEAYERQKFPALSKSSRQLWNTATGSLEEFDEGQTAIRKMQRLADVDADRLARWHAWLRERERSEDTIAAYTRTLMVGLRWAKACGFLLAVPVVNVDRKTKRKRRKMGGRPITDGEFRKLLAAVDEVMPEDERAEWKRLVEGLWLSGLRLGEAVGLSWDDDADLHVDLRGRRPKLRMHEGSHKGQDDVALPLTPDFVAFLHRTPEEKRVGRVFPTAWEYFRAQKGIAAIGRAAHVVVDRKKEKFATAHDLRRSFGTRWAPKVKPIVLQRLMRHKSIETTLSFYVDLDADDLADELWRLGDTFSDTRPSGEGGQESKS